MLAHSLAMAAAFLVAVSLTPFLAMGARSVGWLDHPDTGRKTHVAPVPLTGGCALLLAFITGLAISGTLPDWPLLLAVLTVFTTGLIDDWRGLLPWQKLTGQTIACLLASFSAATPATGLLGTLATLYWLLLCTNAMNLLDGLDGCAATAGLIAALAMLAMANSPAWLLTALAAALAGFLLHNLPPARVFLGDSGSMTLGFLLGYAALLTSGGSPVALLAPAIALSLPLVDTAWAVLRRLHAGQPIFQADRGHVHHLVLARAGSPRFAWLVLAGINLAAAALALAIHRAG
jgi:UDP-GlcNAc:undecaprenyl-phosphate GlcNAc-1-phosphate transferase